MLADNLKQAIDIKSLDEDAASAIVTSSGMTRDREMNSSRTVVKCLSCRSLDFDTKNQKKSSCFMRIGTFVCCLSLLQLVQVMGSGYSKSALTSIERRYRLSSSDVGILQSCFHVGNLSIILFVSYFGSKWHRPRAIAIGSLLMATSSVLSSMPQFVGERYDISRHDWAVIPPIDEHRMQQQSNDNDFDQNLLKKNLSSFSTRDLENAPDLEIDNFKNFSDLNFISYLNDVEASYSNTEPGYKMSRLTNQSSLGLSNFYGHSSVPTSSRKSVLCQPKIPSKNRVSSPKLSAAEAIGSSAKDDSLLYWCIAVGSVLKGMGHTPLHPLGMSFIDDFAAPRNSALYIGLVSALSLLGPAVGFLIGSFTTTVWVDYGWVNSTSIPVGPNDPGWVGAWWMGYLLTAFLLILASIPLLMFPRNISKEEDTKEFCPCVRSYWSGQAEDGNCSTNEDEAVTSPEEIDPNLVRFSLISDDDVMSSLSKSSFYLNNKRYEVASRYSIPREEFLDWSTSKASMKVKRSASAPLANGRSLDAGIARTCTYEAAESKVVLQQTRFQQTSNTLAMKDFILTLKSLLKDPLFMTITLGFVSLTSFLASSITYVPKYMESQFDLTASMANLLNGAVNLPMAVVGNVAGGFVIRRRNLNVKQTIVLVLIGLTITCTAVFILLFCGCPNNNVVGFKKNDSVCYQHCNCDDTYLPVCDVTTSTTYRSACVAGCSQVTSVNGKKMYFNCQCLNRKLNGGNTTHAPLQLGECLENVCWQRLSFFAVVMGIASMAAGLSATPSTLTILRVVDQSDKAFAIGIVFVFTRALAWIPAPVYVGSAIDSSCLHKSNDVLKKQQICEVYNKDWLRTCLFGTTGAQLVCAWLLYFLAYYLVTRRHVHKPRGRLLHGDVIIVVKDNEEQNGKMMTNV